MQEARVPRARIADAGATWGLLPRAWLVVAIGSRAREVRLFRCDWLPTARGVPMEEMFRHDLPGDVVVAANVLAIAMGMGIPCPGAAVWSLPPLPEVAELPATPVLAGTLAEPPAAPWLVDCGAAVQLRSRRSSCRCCRLWAGCPWPVLEAVGRRVPPGEAKVAEDDHRRREGAEAEPPHGMVLDNVSLPSPPLVPAPPVLEEPVQVDPSLVTGPSLHCRC